MGFGRDARKASQSHDWSDGRPRAANWGKMGRQQRSMLTKGDSRIAGKTRDRVAKVRKLGRKKK